MPVVEIFYSLPNGVNPFGNFLVGTINLIIATNLLIQLVAPSVTVAYFIFFAEPHNRIQVPRNLVIPAAAMFGPGAAILLMVIFGIWWSLILNVVYCAAGAAILHYVVVPKSHQLYVSGEIDRLEERLKSRIITLLGGTTPYVENLKLGPRFEAKTQEPLAGATPFLGGIFALIGFLIPFLTHVGEPFATILVLSSLGFFSWAIPIAVHYTLNDPQIHNYVRVPVIAGLLGYYASFTLQSGILFVPALMLGGGYFWWWYNHHPYLKMCLGHARCKEMYASAKVLSVDEFIREFVNQYTAKWGFTPSKSVLRKAADLYQTDALQELPALPEMPPFQPAYSDGQDISLQLIQLENLLKDLPAKTEELVSSITNALNAFTAAIPRPTGPSVFTVSAKELVSDLPLLVHTLGTTFPSGFTTRSIYEQNRNEISKNALSEKAFIAGERIDPEAYANV